MSLLGIMKLLGHRDHRMTLRYTAITQEGVRREYNQALERIRARYLLPTAARRSASPPPTRPSKLIHQAIRWLQTHATSQPKSPSVIKRLQRLETALKRIERLVKSQEK